MQKLSPILFPTHGLVHCGQPFASHAKSWPSVSPGPLTAFALAPLSHFPPCKLLPLLQQPNACHHSHSPSGVLGPSKEQHRAWFLQGSVHLNDNPAEKDAVATERNSPRARKQGRADMQDVSTAPPSSSSLIG